MADTFGTSQGTSSPPSSASTEYERSIARSVEQPIESQPGIREKISEDFSTVKQAAENVASQATDKATEMAEKQKSYAADQIGKFATALEKVGRELESEQAGAVGDYTKQLGMSARHFADKVKDKNLGQIAGIAEDFGRRQPLAFLGIAAIAGLAASRFMMASADRSTKSAAETAPPTNSRESYNG
jgi:ElaB/YqjD/DUF883 family membrane-anchored ribosome-binding protein